MDDRSSALHRLQWRSTGGLDGPIVHSIIEKVKRVDPSVHSFIERVKSGAIVYSFVQNMKGGVPIIEKVKNGTPRTPLLKEYILVEKMGRVDDGDSTFHFLSGEDVGFCTSPSQ